MRVLRQDVDTLEAIVERQIRQRAEEIRDQRQRNLALRIAHLLAGRPIDG